MVSAEFTIDIAGVNLDRVQREVQPIGDFLIGQPLGDELEYFQFPFAERLQQRLKDEG